MAILQVNFLSRALFRTVPASVPLPKIYLACGTEDGLLGPNRAYRDMFREAGLDLTMKKARETTTGNSGTSISATSSTGCRWTKRKPASAAATS